MLGAGLGDQTTARLVILAMMSAYALCRVATSLLRALAGPGELFPVTDTALHATLACRIAAVAVFGYALAEIGLLFGYRIAHGADQARGAGGAPMPRSSCCRTAPVAAWLRGGHEWAAYCSWYLASPRWHHRRIHLIALWTVWALNCRMASRACLRCCSRAVLLVARLILIQEFGWSRAGPPCPLTSPNATRAGRAGERLLPHARGAWIVLLWSMTIVVLLGPGGRLVRQPLGGRLAGPGLHRRHAAVRPSRVGT